jgi:hypothetical protein
MDYPRVHRPPEPKPRNWKMIRSLIAIFVAMSLFGSVAISLMFVLHLDGSRVPPAAKALPWIIGAHTALGVWLIIAVAAGRADVRRRLTWWIASIVVIVEMLGYSMYQGTKVSTTALVMCGVAIVAVIVAALQVRALPPGGSAPDGTHSPPDL